MEKKQQKILIIDDDENIRSMYVDVFTHEGFLVSEAIDGLDGLDKAVKEIPNIIFTGIMMPRMDGFSLLEELKKNVVTANVPVVMSSHMGRQEDKERAMQLGARDFLVKGIITPREVVEKIRSILNLEGYRIKFSPSDLDAEKLAKDMHMEKGFICEKCERDLVLELRLADISNHHQFSGRFVCPNCEK